MNIKFWNLFRNHFYFKMKILFHTTYLTTNTFTELTLLRICCTFYCKIKLLFLMVIPIALDIFRPPLTRPSSVTLPPAASIRVFSIKSSGLWSAERSIALPPRHRTQRESPALATNICLSFIRATTAVVPLSDPGYKDDLYIINLFQNKRNSWLCLNLSDNIFTAVHIPDKDRNIIESIFIGSVTVLIFFWFYSSLWKEI